MPVQQTIAHLRRPGGRIAFDVAGEGPLVVCVPGMGRLRSSYRFTRAGLWSAGFTVATMDLRGHGDSDATFTRYDDMAAAEDTLALIDHLGEPAVIIGNSMGAGAAVIAAADRPGLVAGLGLIGPFVRNPSVSPMRRLMFRAAMSGPWAPKVWLSMLPMLYPSRRPDDFDHQLAATKDSLSRPGYARAFRATSRTDHTPARDRLHSVKAPALVIMGDRDPDFPSPEREASWIAEQIDADIVMVAGAGHYPQAEYPDLVNLTIIDFCRHAVYGT